MKNKTCFIVLLLISFSATLEAQIDILKTDTINKVRVDPSKIPEVIYVVGGRFYMGNTPEQGLPERNNSEPVHEVCLNDYEIGKYPVTVEEYSDYLDKTDQMNKLSDSLRSFYNDSKNKRYPVTNITWEDAKKYCDWLSPSDKTKTYRLPTEAEWEYAARGGQNTEGYKYSGSNNIDAVAWYSGEKGVSNYYRYYDDDYYDYFYDDEIKNTRKDAQPQEVGNSKKMHNELKIYDMSGNVWEYCSDTYETYTAYIVLDGNKPKEDEKEKFYVIRGGSVNSSAENCQVSYRKSCRRIEGQSDIGFRIVREVKK